MFRERLVVEVDDVAVVLLAFIEEEPLDDCSESVFPAWVRTPIRNSSTASRGAQLISLPVSSTAMSDLLRLTEMLGLFSSVVGTSRESPRFRDRESTCIDIVSKTLWSYFLLDFRRLNTEVSMIDEANDRSFIRNVLKP
jgi:hypothetical protein